MTITDINDSSPREKHPLDDLGDSPLGSVTARSTPQRRHVPQSLPIRTLEPRHRAAILTHLLALDAPDRYLRFGYAVSDSHITHYVNQLDFSRDEIYGVYNRKLALIAVAHLAVNANPDQKRLVEFGVSVLGTSRGKGYGAQLFDRALLHARNAGATDMMIHALSENTAMLKIATRAGAWVVRNGAESEAHIQIPQATFASHMDELVGNHMAEWNYKAKWQAKAVHDLLHQLTLPRL